MSKRPPQPIKDTNNPTGMYSVNPTGMYSLAEVVTPERAKEDIAKMVNQRNVNNRRVQMYVKMRMENRWELSPQGLVYDTDGICRDGQHRLHMVVATNLPTLFWVTYNAPRESIIHLDEQMPRTIRDAFKMAEVGSYSCSVISTARVIEILPGDINSRGAADKGEIIRILKTHSEALDFTESSLAHIKFASRGIRALIARAWYHEDEERLSQWCQVLREGIPVSEDSKEDEAAIRYRNFIISLKGSHGHTLEMEKYHKGQTALRKFLDRQQMRGIYGSAKDMYPLPDAYSIEPPKEETKESA